MYIFVLSIFKWTCSAGCAYYDFVSNVPVHLLCLLAWVCVRLFLIARPYDLHYTKVRRHDMHVHIRYSIAIVTYKLYDKSISRRMTNDLNFVSRIKSVDELGYSFPSPLGNLLAVNMNIS